jgi:hypothetical protein
MRVVAGCDLGACSGSVLITVVGMSTIADPGGLDRLSDVFTAERESVASDRGASGLAGSPPGGSSSL